MRHFEPWTHPTDPPLWELDHGWTWKRDDEGWYAGSDDTVVRSSDVFGTLRIFSCRESDAYAPASVCLAVALANGHHVHVRRLPRPR